MKNIAADNINNKDTNKAKSFYEASITRLTRNFSDAESTARKPDPEES